MLVGSAESSTGGFRVLVLYLNTPVRPGAPAGTALPGGSDGLSPLKKLFELILQDGYLRYFDPKVI